MTISKTFVIKVSPGFFNLSAKKTISGNEYAAIQKVIVNTNPNIGRDNTAQTRPKELMTIDFKKIIKRLDNIVIGYCSALINDTYRIPPRIVMTIKLRTIRLPR